MRSYLRNFFITTPFLVLLLFFQNCDNAEFNKIALNSEAGSDEADVTSKKCKPKKSVQSYKFKDVIKMDANFAQHMSAVDLDQDKNIDIVITESTRSKISLLKNNGKAEFEITTSLPTSDRVYSRILTVDLNGDKFVDLATASNSGDLHVWLNNGTGEFTQRDDYSAFGYGVQFVDSGDINKDGHLDIVVATVNDSQRVEGGMVTVFINDGSGNFSNKIDVAAGKMPYGVQLADLNDDDLDEIIFTSREDQKVHVLYNAGDLTFDEEIVFEGSTDPEDSTLTDIIAKDIDRDGFVDLVWGSECRLGKEECHPSVYDQKVYVVTNKKGKNFDKVLTLSTKAYGDVRSLNVTDVNGDGLVDIVSIDDMNTHPFSSRGEYASVSLFLNKCGKKFQDVNNVMLSQKTNALGEVVVPGSSYSNSVVFADFNNDGVKDFVVDAKLNGAHKSSGLRVYEALSIIID